MNLIDKIAVLIFKKTIKRQKAYAVKCAIEIMTESIRDEITQKGWSCDDDMDAKVYADIVDKRMRVFYDSACDILGGKDANSTML